MPPRYKVVLEIETDLHPEDWDWQQLVDMGKRPTDKVIKVAVFGPDNKEIIE